MTMFRIIHENIFHAFGAKCLQALLMVDAAIFGFHILKHGLYSQSEDQNCC